MKNKFLIHGRMLWDDSINSGFDKALFNSPQGTISKSLRSKCLADLGTGSYTEFDSALELYYSGDKSPEFKEWLLSHCTKTDIGNSYMAFGLLNFLDDPRVAPVIVKSAKAVDDENFANYAMLLGIIGGKPAKAVLLTRFKRLLNSSEAFKYDKFCNFSALGLQEACQSLLCFDSSNEEAAAALVKLIEHPCKHNRQSAVLTVMSYYRLGVFRTSRKISNMFRDRLKSLLKSRDDGLFLSALQFLKDEDYQKTYNRLKRTYQKGNDVKRKEVATAISGLPYHAVHITSRLVRELPQRLTRPLLDLLKWEAVKPLTYKEIAYQIREELMSSSPYRRYDAASRLYLLEGSIKSKLVKEALKDEPDEFIQKKLREYLKKGK